MEDVKKRRELAGKKKRDKKAKIKEKKQKQGYQNFFAVTKSLIWLGLDLLYGFILFLSNVFFSKNITGNISLIKYKNCNNLIVMSAF